MCRWGGRRVFYLDETEHVCSMPVNWTSLADVDVFVTFSRGRSLFRFADLSELALLVEDLKT